MSRRGEYGDNAVAESFFSSLGKERIRKGATKPEIQSAPTSSTTSKCSTTPPAATATWAASVPKRLNAPRFQAGQRL